MAAYTDYNFYKNTFFGDVLTEDNALKWLSLASDEIDTITFGRLGFAFPTIEIHAEKVCKAVCAVAEALFNIDLQRKATAVQQASDGSYRGSVASVSSGRESISYSVNNASASIYAAAAANANEQAKLIGNIAVKYLANIPDANGINLLYAGGVRRVPKHYNDI